MNCPACREQMIVVEYKQIELDVCTSCRGVWFDADELELMLKSLQLSVEGLAHPLLRKSVERARKCPYCRRKMEKALVGPGGGVVIDRCKKGHGLWFDGGELDTVIGRLRSPALAADLEAREAGEPSRRLGSFLADVLLAQHEKSQKGEQR